MACGILVPRPRIEPTLPALEVWSPNHWTAREVLVTLWKVSTFLFSPSKICLPLLFPLDSREEAPAGIHVSPLVHHPPLCHLLPPLRIACVLVTSTLCLPGCLLPQSAPGGWSSCNLADRPFSPADAEPLDCCSSGGVPCPLLLPSSPPPLPEQALFNLIFIIFGRVACGTPALEAPSLNHWTAREILPFNLKSSALVLPLPEVFPDLQMEVKHPAAGLYNP